MKRSYQNIIINKNGTISGVRSVSSVERICIFTDSVFTIAGYHDADEEELVELLFVYYIMPDNVVPRRIFERCVFSFVGFTLGQIDDVMSKLTRRKRPGNLYYSFLHCKVLSDGMEILDYSLPEDIVANEILRNMPDYVRMAALKPDCKNEYNLLEMTVSTKNDKDSKFNQDYHELMKLRRATRLTTSMTSYGDCRSNKKRRSSCLRLTANMDKQQII